MIICESQTFLRSWQPTGPARPHHSSELAQRTRRVQPSNKHTNLAHAPGAQTSLTNLKQAHKLVVSASHGGTLPPLSTHRLNNCSAMFMFTLVFVHSSATWWLGSVRFPPSPTLDIHMCFALPSRLTTRRLAPSPSPLPPRPPHSTFIHLFSVG